MTFIPLMCIGKVLSVNKSQDTVPGQPRALMRRYRQRYFQHFGLEK
jgi:hypothetical protein